jgi:hypothetical protein
MNLGDKGLGSRQLMYDPRTGQPIGLGGDMGAQAAAEALQGAPMMEGGRAMPRERPNLQPDQLKQHLGGAATVDEKSALLRALRGL